MLPYTTFYQKYGNKTLGDLHSPKLVSLAKLRFPLHATIYQLTQDHLHQVEFPVTNVEGMFYVKPVIELKAFASKPKPRLVQRTGILKNIRAIGGLPVTKTLDTLTTTHSVIVDHANLTQAYHYVRSPLVDIDSFANYMQTVVADVAEDTSNRVKLVIVPVTDTEITVQWLRITEGKTKLWLHNHLTEVPDLLAIEFNKYWLQEESWLTPLRNLDIVFMFTYRGNATLLHNSMFNIMAEDFSEKENSNNLVRDIPTQKITQVRPLLPQLLHKLHVGSVTEEEDTEDTEPVQAPVSKVAEVKPVQEVLIAKAAGNKTLIKAITQASTVHDPYPVNGKPVTLGEVRTVEPAKAKLPPKLVTTSPADQAYTTLSANHYDETYHTHAYRTDIVNAIKGVQRTGILITGIESKVTESVLGDKEHITISTRGLDGAVATLPVTLPVFNPDGSYTLDGIHYRMRKQRVEAPIIKTSPSKVVLNSYYGTLFITRSTKVVDDIGRHIARAIGKLIATDPSVTGIPLDVFDYSAATPVMYAKLAQHYKLVHTKQLTLNFSYHDRQDIPGYSPKLETDGVVCGYTATSPIVMKADNLLYVNDQPIGTVMEALGISSDIPLEIAQMKILGVEIPVAVFLGGRLGLSHILEHTEYTVSDKRSNSKLLTLAFSDVYVHITAIKDPAYTLIVNSLQKLLPLMKRFTLAEFDSPDMFQLWIQEQGLPIRYFNEFELLDDLFIDDVSTRQLLVEMHEPTEFKALVIRACEMLTTESHARPNDGKLLRVRGNERVAGFIYKALSMSARGYKNTVNINKKKMELAPWEVFNLVTGDDSVKPVENNNPIQFVKDRETVTLGGEGGRSGATLTIDNRRLDPADLGFIGEAASDNGDVGMVAYMSASPMISDIRGMNTSTIKDAKENPAACYTTTFMLTPGLTKDHMPRVSFVSTQNTHTIAIQGGETPYIRTGYEYIFPFKVGKFHAWMAPQDGEVTAISTEGLTVKYTDGSTESGKLGIAPGKSGDKLYPHHIVTPLTKGAKFKQEDPITYNTGFFAMDDLYPNKLCFLQAKMVNTAFVDDLDTYEDSFSVSDNLTPLLNSEKLVMKRIILTADSVVTDVIPVGATVGVDTPLMTITDAIAKHTTVTGGLNDLFASVPHANTKGTVVSLVVYYNGELDELDPSIRTLAIESDTRLAKQLHAEGKPLRTGKVSTDHRINGKPMLLNTVEVLYNILSSSDVSRGDKFVLGSQLKATVGRIFNNTRYTSTGVPYEATFSYRSVLARIVNSYQDVGTYSLFMEHLGKHLANKLGV